MRILQENFFNLFHIKMIIFECFKILFFGKISHSLNLKELFGLFVYYEHLNAGFLRECISDM